MRLTLLICCGLMPSIASATDWFVSPRGNGSNTGLTRPNAAGPSDLAEISGRLAPGDRLVLAAGDYGRARLVLTNSGKPRQPITVVCIGEEKARFFGDSGSDKRTGIAITGSHYVIENLAVGKHSTGFAVTGNEGEPVDDITFRNCETYHITTGFTAQNATHVAYEQCRACRYKKRGFQLVSGNREISYTDCFADCLDGDEAWTRNASDPAGFNASAGKNGAKPNEGVRYTDCVSQFNTEGASPKSQGDGWLLENATTAVTFVRCVARDNRDAGFDVKTKDETTWTDCRTVRAGKRGFKLWYGIHELTNCISVYTGRGIWTDSGHVIANYSTFHDDNDRTAVAEKPEGQIELVHSLATFATESSDATFRGGDGVVIYRNSLQRRGVGGGFYMSPSPRWDGFGNSYDPRSQSRFGYRSTGLR